MLSALRREDHKQVILLREDGLAMAEALRAQAREDRIVCEVCAQPVLVRAGTERTWHFAHRTREHCPKAQESMELIECRALLYGWLRVRFPDAVQLEKVLPGLPRPVDCWVDRPGKPPLAWWLVTAGLKPEVRDQLAQGFAEAGALSHYVFLARMLTPDPDLHRGFILGTTERDLMRPSNYGELYGGLSQSLHYLDGATRRLTTCRGLIPAHPPQGYRADLQEHPLEEVRILPSTGEFVNPGEAEGLKALLEAARQEEAQRQEALRAARQTEGTAPRGWLRRRRWCRSGSPWHRRCPSPRPCPRHRFSHPPRPLPSSQLNQPIPAESVAARPGTGWCAMGIPANASVEPVPASPPGARKSRLDRTG